MFKEAVKSWSVSNFNWPCLLGRVQRTCKTSTGLLQYLCFINGTSSLGEFGDVYQGTLSRPDEEPILVAVKTLKVSSRVPLFSFC